MISKTEHQRQEAQEKKKMKPFLSIDPGQDYGAALFVDGRCYQSMSGNIYSDKDRRRLFDMLVFDGRDPHMYIICEYGGWSGQAQAYGLGRNLGYLLGSLRAQGKPKCIRPSEWKKIVFGRGVASKQEAFEKASAAIKGWTVSNHNEAEAILIGMAEVFRNTGTNRV